MLTDGDSNGRLLMDFFTNTYMFYEVAPPHLVRSFIDLLRSRVDGEEGKQTLQWVLNVYIIKT